MAELAMQTPPPGHFSFFELSWTPVSHRPPPTGGDKAEAMTVQQAKIPWDRVRDFITGEEARGACNFYVRGGQTKKPEQLQKATRKDSHSEFRIYHCVHGPEDDSVPAQSATAADDAVTDGAASGMDSQAGPEGAIAPDGSAAAGEGASPPANPKRKNKRARGEGARVGCQVRFKVARPVAEPEAARITWLGSTQHANKAGIVVHGPGCAAAAANPRLAMATHISQNAKLWVAAQLRANLPRAEILKHNQGYIRAAVCNGEALSEEEFEARLKAYPAAQRDFLLKTQDIDNIAKRLESYPPPADGLPVTHPAALGGPQAPVQSATYSALLADGAAGAGVHMAAAGDQGGEAMPPARRQRVAVPAARAPHTLGQVHDTAQRILNALAAAPPETHRALLGVVVPTLEALWQRISAMAPAIAADAAPPGEVAAAAGLAAAPLGPPAAQVGQYAAHTPQQQAAPGQHLPPLPGSLVSPSGPEAVQMAGQPSAAQPAGQLPYAAANATVPLQTGVHGHQGAYADPADPGAVELPGPGFSDAAAPGPQLDALMAAGQLQEQQQQQLEQHQQPPHEQQQHHEQEPQAMQQ